jgi:uncharacterized protein
MTRYYLESSAAAKLMVGEAESQALRTWCDRDEVELVGSDLVETELRRIAQRREIPQQAATAVLDGIDLHEITRSVFAEAGLLPGRLLRGLDALHLASALHLGVTAVATYDERLGDAARAVGLEVVAPT